MTDEPPHDYLRLALDCIACADDDLFTQHSGPQDHRAAIAYALTAIASILYAGEIRRRDEAAGA